MCAKPSDVPPTGVSRHSASRIAWIDVARALGIALVVWGHVERGLVSAGIATSPAWVYIDFVIYTFHMPLFFYLSGLNVMRSREKPGFFIQRVKAIALPYFVFSLLLGAVRVALDGQTNGTLTVTDLLLIPIHPIAPFWFLYVLLIYMAFVALWKPGRAMLAVALAMFLVAPLSAGLLPGVPLFNILYFFIFFVAGALFPMPRLPNRAGLSAFVVFALTCFAAPYWQVSPSAYYAQFMLPAAVSGILLRKSWKTRQISSAISVAM